MMEEMEAVALDDSTAAEVFGGHCRVRALLALPAVACLPSLGHAARLPGLPVWIDRPTLLVATPALAHPPAARLAHYALRGPGPGALMPTTLPLCCAARALTPTTLPLCCSLLRSHLLRGRRLS